MNERGAIVPGGLPRDKQMTTSDPQSLHRTEPGAADPSHRVRYRSGALRAAHRVHGPWENSQDTKTAAL